ncbi:unnamed protein product [Pneumocystis jirovecii]|uniref:Cell division control protein 25 n=1 Tax=Pneumocystis jirovecii TaxID=42068 RepID=L0PC91_PNEJI|nr:unnamed protein product [Pneumocystis jirovecii]
MFDSDASDTDFCANKKVSSNSKQIIEIVSDFIPKRPNSPITTDPISETNKVEDSCYIEDKSKWLSQDSKHRKQLSLVRALYDFNSPELSSLKFSAGDVIEVLNKLENGWWDGILGDQRGWFPSNYVEHLEENEINEFNQDIVSNQKSSNDDNEDDDTYSIQIGLEQSLIPKDSVECFYQKSKNINNTLNDPTWVPDIALDKQTSYLNTEIEIPETNFSPFLTYNDYSNDNLKIPKEKISLLPIKNKKYKDLKIIPHLSKSPKNPYVKGDLIKDFNNQKKNFMEYEDSEKVQNNKKSSKEQLKSFAFLSQSPSVETISPLENFIISSYENQLDIQSLSENSISNENSSKMSDSDDGSSVLMPIYYRPQTPTNFKDLETTYLSCKALKLLPEELIPSYRKIFQNMRQSINDLHKFILLNMKVLFQKLCDSIKITVIYLVHASNMLRIVSMIDNPFPTIISISENDFKTIKWYYRKILATLSRLILSTKLASSEWLPENITSSVLNDAEDVITIVEEYIEFIISRDSIYKTPCKIRPGFIKDRQVGGGWKGNGLIMYTKPTVHNNMLLESKCQSSDNLLLKPLSQELLSKLDAFLNEIKYLLNKFQRKLLKPNFTESEKKSSIIVSEFFIIHETQAILKSLSIFMEMIELVDVTPLGEIYGDTYSPTLFDFLNAKQALYDSINTLVLIVQSFPKFINMYNNDPIMSIVNSSRNLNCSLQSLMMTIEFLVGEKEIRTKRRSEDLAHSAHLNSSQKSSISSNISVESNDYKTLLKTSPATPRTKTKLKKIFGDESPFGKSPHRKASSVFQIQNETTPWFLEHNHEGRIVYDDQGYLKAGTLMGLIEHLTRHDLFDSLFNNTFLLTYRTLISAEDFFDLLVKRFMVAPPGNLKSHELEIWVEKKQKPIRLRVFNILKIWLENHFMESIDENSKKLLNRIKEFTVNILSESIPVENLIRIIDKRIKNEDENHFRRLILNIGLNTPPPLLPKNLKKFKLLDLDPLEIARQLTIIEKCLNKAWSKNFANDIAENIKSMILKSNQITGWVTHSILSQSEVKKRVDIIKHFINIADRCRSLNNFSTLTSIISGINSAPIHRLKRTWELINKKTINIFDSLNKIMDSAKNFSEYRELLHVINPPCVPFLGVYLTDLTFIEDGNPDMIKNSKDLINFSKRIKTAEVIREIQQYQSVSYSFQIVPEIQTYIFHCLKGMDTLGDMYDLSLGIEPRERDDEKLTRLLQESGLL